MQTSNKIEVISGVILNVLGFTILFLESILKVVNRNGKL